MNVNNVMTRLMGGALLLVIAPLSNAWVLVNKANSDPHIIGWDFRSVSGSASAFDNGVPNQYAGNVECRSSHSQCLFGPMSGSFPGSYFSMGCEPLPGSPNCLNFSDTAVKVTNGMTWDQAISLWNSRYGTTVFRQNAYTFYSMSTSLCTMWGSFASDSLQFVPGTMACGSVPTVPNQCNVSGGDVDLNHGLLNTGEITGKKVEVTRQVSCTRRTTIRYIVSLGNPVDLGNGISSSITVNGIEAGQTMILPGGTSSLVFASTLTDKGAKPGDFSKTAVLIQSFM